MGHSDLEKRSDLALRQPGSLSPLLEFSRRGNDSRFADGAMRHRESVTGLHSDALRLISSKLTCNGALLETRANLARNSSVFSPSFIVVTTLSI